MWRRGKRMGHKINSSKIKMKKDGKRIQPKKCQQKHQASLPCIKHPWRSSSKTKHVERKYM
jgi:hypothetical protein